MSFKLGNLKLMIVVGLALMLVAALACSAEEAAAPAAPAAAQPAAAAIQAPAAPAQPAPAAAPAAPAQPAAAAVAEKAAAPEQPKAAAAARTAAPAAARTAPAAKPITKETAMYVAPRQVQGQYPTRVYEGPRPTTFQENPKFAQMVKDGTLPALDDRMPIPDERLVLEVADEIGVYGGTWRRADNYFYHMGIINRSDCILEDYDHFTYYPYTCKTFELNERGNKFTFTLRDGHKWSDGEPFTVADVAFAWQDLNYMESVPGPHPEVYKGWAPSSYRDPITGNDPVFTVEDAFTFSISFDSPHFQFPAQLRHTRGSRCRYKCFTSPKHYASQFHPKYADAAELTKLIKEGEHKDWTDLFLTRNEMYLGFQNELPWIGPYYNIGGSSIGDTFAEHTANPYFMAVDPMGNQMPYTDSMYLTKHESHEVAIFRAMAGEHDAGVHGFEIMELPMYQSQHGEGRLQPVLLVEPW